MRIIDLERKSLQNEVSIFYYLVRIRPVDALSPIFTHSRLS